jgi:hypothetical protein
MAHQDRRPGIRPLSPHPPDRLSERGPRPGRHLHRLRTDTDYHRADHHPNLRWNFNAPRKRKFGDPKLEPGETEVPVCNYFIAARLTGGNERVEKTLRDCGKMSRAAGDMWVLRSKQTVQQLRNQLSMIMKPHESFVIVNASKDRLAWYNIGVEADISVRGVWDSDEVQ